ncbi:sugar lactone lactonase YvrE [Solirubrobacter pauli]|uniref:Sugar lactone lactonase YvrE n=1 Tax=Solirubrobacter pauli TaxID=166793 RepID=A0A660LGR0_9ACTN|nr:sugar lactone lactonase YvrE [Solirubrobacter pauli]
MATGLGLVPSALAVDGGELIVGDQQNGAIRSVTLSTGGVTTLAGTGAAGSSAANTTSERAGVLTQLPGYGASVAGPLAVAVAADGDVVFSVGSGGTLRRLDRTTGTLTRIAGTGAFSSTGAGDGGPALQAGLSLVRGLAVDADGAILLADGGAGKIRRIDPATNVITTVAGGGSSVGDGGAAGGARLSDPRQIALDPGTGDLLVAEFGGHRVRRVAAGADGRVGATDTITTIAGDGTAATADTLGDGGPASAARLNAPSAVAVLPNGAVAIAEAASNRLRLVRPDATITTVPTAALGTPAALAVRGADRLFVAETSATTRRVQELTIDPATGALTTMRTVAGNGSNGFSGHTTPAVEAQLADPRAITVAPDGSYYIADNANARVRRVDPATGKITTVIGSGMTCPNPTDTTCVENVPALEAKLTRPWDVAVAADGTVYVLESNALISRISRFDPRTGRLVRLAGGAIGFAGDGGPARDARFNEAQGIVLDAAGRYLYVADTNNRRVRRIDLQQDSVTTIAGTGVLGATGNGGPAAAATLQGLLGISLGLDGDLLVPDNTARSVRRIDLATGGIDEEVEALGEHEHDHGSEADAEPQSIVRVAERAVGHIVLVDGTGHAVYEAERHGDHHHVNRIAGTGTRDFTGESGRSLTTALAAPYDAAITPAGHVLIADGGNNRIRLVELAPVEEPTPTPTPTAEATPDADTPQPAAPEPAERRPASPAAPAVRVTVGKPTVKRADRRVARLRAGLTVRTAVHGATRLRAEIRVSAATAKRLRTRTRLAVLTRSVADGTVSLRLRPGAAVRERLAQSRRNLRVTIRVVATAPGAEEAVTSATLSLRG